MKKVAVVTGANRGIGLEICRQLAAREIHVVLTARGEGAAEAAAAVLMSEKEGLAVEPHRLDVAAPESIADLAAHLGARHGGLDILVNNAGIAMQGFNAEVARQTIEVNYHGTARLTARLLPVMRAGGRIVMLSSGLADRGGLPEKIAGRFTAPALTLAELDALMDELVADVAAGRHAAAGWPSSAYRVSKMGVNALAHVLGRSLREDPRGLLVNAVCPGWVRTSMGGAGAPRSVEDGAETPVWAALLPAGGPQGGFFRDMAPATW